MSDNLLIFLRHTETEINENIIISKWILTEKGKEEAIDLLKSQFFKNIDVIITSDEEKAYQTAYPLSTKLNKNIIRDKKLNEIIRDKGNHLKSKNEYIKHMKLCMENRNQSFKKWETSNHALKRFSNRIQEIEKKHTNKKILIVSHGVVINLYFAKILGYLDNVFERWLTNSFCDYGIIQNGKIIKDIAKT